MRVAADDRLGPIVDVRVDDRVGGVAAYQPELTFLPKSCKPLFALSEGNYQE
jgi:hypothetical protein